MKYLLNLVQLFVLYITSLFITPFLPLFAEVRMGLSDNANREEYGPRLPDWLKYYDTPDNSLNGDKTFQEKNGIGYWQKVRWLYRNSLYGFKWTKLAAPMDLDELVIEGPTDINYRGPKFGTFRANMGEYWQYKSVKRLSDSYCVIINLGWLLDDKSQKKALFMFSIRPKKVVYVIS